MNFNIKAYKVKGFKKVNCENFQYDFPILYPDFEYFSKVSELLQSFGVVLEKLMDNNFDFDAYCREIKEDPYLSVFVNETDFEIEGGEYKDCPLAEHIFNQEDEILWEAYYVTNPKTIIEKDEDMRMEVQLHIALGDKYNLYLNGSYMYAKVNDKSYCLYLD